MFSGVHTLLYSRDADADRRFLRDMLGLRAVDAGEGWLIFGLPPGELGVHPANDDAPPDDTDDRVLTAHVYLMCADVPATIASLRSKGVRCTDPRDAGWGVVTTIPLPSGGSLGLYQPRHPTAF